MFVSYFFILFDLHSLPLFFLLFAQSENGKKGEEEGKEEEKGEEGED